MTLYILPAIFISIIGYGFYKKTNVFESFLTGAKSGLSSCLNITPALVGLITAVSMMRASGILDFVANIFSPVLNVIQFPSDVFPMALLKSVSGSGALAMLKDIFQTAGVDSHSGKLASIMLGSSETTFYALAVYFGATKVKNTRYTVLASVIADIVGIIAAVVVCHLFFA